MADRFFQGYIHQLQGSISRNFGIINTREIIACSNQDLIGLRNSFSLMMYNRNENESFVIENYTYQIFYENNFIKFAVFVEGKDKTANDYSVILSVCFQGMKPYLEEKYNRHLFYKNLFLENILSEDINVQANMLKIPLAKTRVVFILRFPQVEKRWDLSVLVQSMELPRKHEIFTTTETDVILIAEVKADSSREEIEELGGVFRKLALEFFQSAAVVGVGSKVTDISQLQESYKEALYALELLYLFEGECTVINFNRLGINRLVYQLPLPLCKYYLKEVFVRGGFDTLNKETLETVKCFFDNNLNISETARQLYIHRNTLMYRLEKVKKLTALDVRIFDHAVIFKLALVIYKHVKCKE